MALARIACGNCGAMLSVGDHQCPQCGEKIEFGLTSVSCPSCKHINLNSGAFCESCGARMQTQRSPLEKSTPSKGSHKKPPRAGQRRRFEPWQMTAGVGMFLLLVYFVYSEVDRQYPPAKAAPEIVPLTVPGEELNILEKRVAENPKDATLLLHLANRLHDAGLNEPRFIPKAIESYKKYLVLNPADPDARVDLGICYFELGKLDSLESSRYFRMATSEMEEVVNKHSDHQPAAFNLGIVTLFMGNIEGSNRWFSKAVALNPESDMGKRAKNLLEQHSIGLQ